MAVENLQEFEGKVILEERECDAAEKKSVLQERLRGVLIQEGDDPYTYLFEI